jgi:arylsulfatase A-like enzyme
MKKILLILFFGALLFWGCHRNTHEKPPNIIIIMADDLGYGDLSIYDHPDIDTPHLDLLAKTGIRFTDFHSNGTVCSPTRAALLSGKYQQRVGIDGVITAKYDRDKGLSLSEKTFAEYAKEAQYTTGMFGKWHLGYDPKFNPIHQGFDDYVGFVSGNVDYHSHIDQEGYEDWWAGDQLKKEKGYSTDLITDHAVRFIKQHHQSSFLLYIAHEAPHYPFQGRQSEAERKIRGSENNNFINIGAAENKTELYKEMVEVMDEGIGVVLQTLKSLEIEEQTFIFFMSDNGASRYGNNGVLKGYKGSLWEGGHRVAAIANWPGRITAGQVLDEPLMTMDVFPTVLELMGAPEKNNIDGLSFKDYLLLGKKPIKRDLFWQFKKKLAMRSGPWKLVLENPDLAPQLFHLDQDIAETTDLASQFPEQRDKLLKKLMQWRDEVNN